MGEPANLTKAQTELLRASAKPLFGSDVISAENGKADISLTAKRNGVVYFELTPRTFTPDRGYDYDKVLSFH